MVSLLLISYGPSLYTLKGVRRTISAIAPNYVMGQYSPFALVFNFSQAYGWIANELPFKDKDITGQDKEYIDGFYSASDLFGLGYGQKFFELAIMGSYHFDGWDKNNPSDDRFYPDNLHSHGWGDLYLAGKLIFPVHFESVSFSLGVAGLYFTPKISNIQIAHTRDTSQDKFISDSRGWYQKGGVFRTFTYGDQGYAIRGLFTFLPNNKYLQINLNYGYSSNNLSDGKDDQIFYGASIMATLPGFQPFFEVSLEDFYKDREWGSPFYITGGANLDAGGFIIAVGAEKVFWFDGSAINQTRDLDNIKNYTHILVDTTGRKQEMTRPNSWFNRFWNPNFALWLGLSYTFVPPVEKKPEKEKPQPTYIAGVVFDKASGKTLGNVNVLLKETNVSVVTGDDGAYKFENVNPGSYTLIFTAQNYTTTTRVVDVRPGQPAIVNVELIPAKAVYITGVVYDGETNRPLGGAKVLVKETGAEAITQDDGSYKIENVISGSYTLIFTAPGYQSFSASVAVEDKPVVKDAYLAKGEEVQKAEVKTGSILGIVTDKEKGTPISGVSVVLKETGQTLTTDRSGSFRFDNLKAGAYTLSFDAEGYLDYSEIVNLAEGQTFTMRVALTPVPQKKGANLLGKVSDAESGKGIAGAVVSVEGVTSATTDNDGIYKIENVPPGTYTVKVSAIDYQTYTEVIRLNEGDNVKNFSLQTSVVKGSLIITVVDKNSKKPLSATVIFEGQNFGPYETDPSSGSVTIKDIPAGSYNVKVKAKDAAYAEQLKVVVVEKGTKEVTFELVKKGVEVTFRNIYFDLNKATLKPESEPALREICTFLKENPDILVEIQGHTDTRGSDAYNLRLSQARAESVVEWLINNGCADADRLVPKGYGESAPVVKNAKTEAEHALNRRVVVKVLGIRK